VRFGQECWPAGTGEHAGFLAPFQPLAGEPVALASSPDRDFKQTYRHVDSDSLGPVGEIEHSGKVDRPF
jgi:hypothetical protein